MRGAMTPRSRRVHVNKLPRERDNTKMERRMSLLAMKIIGPVESAGRARDGSAGGLCKWCSRNRLRGE